MKFTVYQAYDMGNPPIYFPTEVLEASSTRLSIYDPSQDRYGHYTGSGFTYDVASSSVTGGILTGYSSYIGASQLFSYEATDVALPFTEFIELNDSLSNASLLEIVFSGNDELFGSHFNDVLNAEAGNDIIDGGRGDDRIDGGIGTDYAVFSGKYADYDITYRDATVFVNGEDGYDTLENIEYLRFSDRDVSIDTLKIGDGLDSYEESLLVAAAYLAARAYSDYHLKESASYIDASVADWSPVHLEDIGLKEDQFDNFISKTSYVGANDDLLRISVLNSSVSVGVTNLNGQKTLGISFEGSNTGFNPFNLSEFDNAASDWFLDIFLINGAYGAISSFLEALAQYIEDSDLDQVLVSGHSLGGALAQIFYLKNKDINDLFKVITFGSPGSYEILGQSGDEILNIYHSNDPVPLFGLIRSYQKFGTDTQLFVDYPGLTLAGEHSLTENDINYINSSIILSNYFSYSDLLSNDMDFHLGSYLSESLSGNLFSIDRFIPSAGDDVVHGGSRTDYVYYAGRFDEYLIEFHNPSLASPYYTVTDLTTSDFNEGIDKLYDIEKLIFSDTKVTLGKFKNSYISGGEIFVDANENGVADPAESTGVFTDEYGNFQLVGDYSGSLIAVGGIKIDTGLENVIPLTAPNGSAIISPLTSLISTLMNTESLDQEVAENQVKGALGISDDIDLTTFDPLADASDEGLEIQKIDTQLGSIGTKAVEIGSDFSDILSEISQSISSDKTIDLIDETYLADTFSGILSEDDLEDVIGINTLIESSSNFDDITEAQLSLYEEVITIGHKVAGLYAAFFNRAPDASGLSYWEDYVYVQGLSLDDLAAAFTTHPIFTETYGGLSNQDFVEAIYQNMLGGAGDQGGIDYWVGELDGGLARSKMVSDFVQGSLVIDLDAMLSDGVLTQQEYDDAVGRQNFITNKAMVGVEFAQRMGELSNVTSEGLDLLEDPAYLASIAILENVNNTPESYDVIIELINDATEADGSPLDFIIDEVEQVASQSVTSNWLSYDLI